MEASSAPLTGVVRFGVFELDLRSGELRKSGLRVNLQGQPLKVLECLLERPGELVTRDQLRRRLWPDDTFVDFERGVNAAVKRLRETLADSADTPRFIETLPRRGYRFIVPVIRDSESHQPVASAGHPTSPASDAARAPAVETPPLASRWHRSLIAAGAIAAVLATLVTWLRWPAPMTAAPPLQVVSLTTLTGSENWPTFSPDGRQVAFAWDGERQDNFDIYVKLVGSSDLRRLTTDTAADVGPQWSPDGKWIAFTRVEWGGLSRQTRLISPLGGSERALGHALVGPPAWSPDGRYLVAGRASQAGQPEQSTGLDLIPVDAGEPRPLTRVVAPATDGWPAVSLDGRHLAYSSCSTFNCHVHVLDLDSTLTPHGPARRLTPTPVFGIQGLTWSRDGTFVVYAARQAGVFYLWRVAANGEHPPVRLEVAGIEARSPATTAGTDRLAFSRSIEDEDLYRLDVGGAARPIARSSVKDTNPQFSPDGRQVAFCSAREGDAFEVWVADTDGSNPRRLTRGPGRWQCSPTWSPDGQRIAFDSLADDGSWHVWTIDVAGGTPRPITKDAGDQVKPTWSRDGQWIYFIWRRESRSEIWRTRGPDRPHERVTFSGTASTAWESADRTGVFYKRLPGEEGSLEFQPLSGGAPRVVIACASHWFSVGLHDISYVPCQPKGSVTRDIPVHVLNLVTGENRRLATIADLPFPESWSRIGTFAVSPDRRTILYSALVASGADLMLIENFR